MRSARPPNARRRRPARALLSLAIALGSTPLAAQESAEASAAPEAKAPIRQVRVEVRVLEWQLNNSTDFDFAVLFSGETGTVVRSADLTLPSPSPLSSAARLFLAGLDTGHGSFEVVIEALRTVGRIRVLSEPTLIVTIGEATGNEEKQGKDASYAGRVTQRKEIPYEKATAFGGGSRIATTTEYRDTGVALECSALPCPYDGLVRLHLKATVTDLTGFINIGTDGENQPLRVPVLDSRELQSQILVQNGSVLIAGLLKANREIERRQGIPWISELPVLRWFLRNVSTDDQVTELVFLVKPEFIDPIEAP